MIKVPATSEGLPAIHDLTAEGINVNITLLFAQQVYEQVVEAYLSGLEALAAKGGEIAGMASVASFFVSRIDTEVDKLLDEKIARVNDPDEKARLAKLKGKVAVANAKLAYQRYSAAVHRRTLACARRTRRQAAAAVVGFNRHQEQGLQRRPLHRRTDRRGYGEHDAARDD